MSRATDTPRGVRILSCVLFLALTTTVIMSFAPEDWSVPDNVQAPVEAALETPDAPAPDTQALIALRGSFEAVELPFLDGRSTFEIECAMSAPARLARWSPLIAEASDRFGVPRSWIRAVLKRESDGRTVMKGDRPLRSRAGAMGLMQLMPDTWTELRDKYGLGNDPHDPHDNVFAGTAYLQYLKSRYGYPALFIAYNHGPGNLERHLATNSRLPRETRDYVAAITANLGTGTVLRSKTRRAVTFVTDGTPPLRLASLVAAD